VGATTVRERGSSSETPRCSQRPDSTAGPASAEATASDDWRQSPRTWPGNAGLRLVGVALRARAREFLARAISKPALARGDALRSGSELVPASLGVPSA